MDKMFERLNRIYPNSKYVLIAPYNADLWKDVEYDSSLDNKAPLNRWKSNPYSYEQISKYIEDGYRVGWVVPAGEMLAEIIEIDLVHVVEEKPEQALLTFAVVVEMKFHQYDERQKEHKTINQREPATGEVNKGDERVVASQCSVEVEGVYFFSMFHSQ